MSTKDTRQVSHSSPAGDKDSNAISTGLNQSSIDDSTQQDAERSSVGEHQNTPADLEAGSKAVQEDESNNQPFSVFTHSQKRGIVIAAAAGAVFSPLTAQIYLPALPTIAKDLGVTFSEINLTVTTYMIFQGLTPMFVGAFADSAGRRPAYMYCFTVYMAANIGCALAPNYAALLVLRMLQSAGSSTTVALAQAVVADIVTSAERGLYVSYMSLPMMLAPALGPVLGGALAEYLGWRWTFWILTIMCGVVALAHLLWMPETCRGIVGDGSIRPKHLVHRSLWQVGRKLLTARRRKASLADGLGQENEADLSSSSASAQVATKRKFNAFRSILILIQPGMAILLLYSSLILANFYCLMTSIPVQFNLIYHLTDFQTGLIYLPLGLGTLIGSQITGRLLDKNFRRHCDMLNIPYARDRQLDLSHFPLERARLEVGIAALVLATALTLVWGWVLHAQTHIAVPCVVLFLAGIGLTGFTNTISTLIVDMNPGDAGAAMASSNLTRCLIGAGASAAIQPMIDGLGVGWAFTVLAGVSGLFGPPALWFVLRKGMAWRVARAERLKIKMGR